MFDKIRLASFAGDVVLVLPLLLVLLVLPVVLMGLTEAQRLTLK